MSSLTSSRVAVVRTTPKYNREIVEHAVTQVLQLLGVGWQDLIDPGDRVLLKPNFIRESHTDRPDEWEQIITHGTVIAAVAGQVAEAMGGHGTITIADAPQTDSNFQKICERAQIPELQESFRRKHPGITLEVLDLRREAWQTRNGVVVERRKLPEDPRGYTQIDLGSSSCFHGVQGRFYGADYDTNSTAVHHSKGVHEYLLSRSAMDADLFINLPKLKTHKKVGVTLSLKNLVGINGDKNYLPHFRIGTPDQGGGTSSPTAVPSTSSKAVQSVRSRPWRGAPVPPPAGGLLWPSRLAPACSGAPIGACAAETGMATIQLGA